MSEEKPTFKVTDRRLFNTDGSPREDAHREQETDSPKTGNINSSQTQTPQPAATVTSAPTEARQPKAEVTTTAAANNPRAATSQETSQSLIAEDASLDDSSDPTQFINLVMFIASPAAASLGLTEHPAMGGREVDLELAKHCIDLLGALQQKTRGNLSFEEQQTLEGLLAELRMQYLSLTGGITAPVGAAGRRGGGAAGGGFTGGDITGGR